MKRLNSKFTDSQHKLISSTQKKFRLYYAIMLKYYESHHKFFDDFPKISGSLLTNIAVKLDLETTSIIIPSARYLHTYLDRATSGLIPLSFAKVSISQKCTFFVFPSVSLSYIL